MVWWGAIWHCVVRCLFVMCGLVQRVIPAVCNNKYDMVWWAQVRSGKVMCVMAQFGPVQRVIPAVWNDR